MKTKRMILVIAAIAVLATAYFAVEATAGRGNGPTGEIYVINQGLFFETFATADLPMKGPFQRLYTPPVDGVPFPMTEYGPGDPGYVGGRWWIDDNLNGYMDEGDTFFSCPLLPPGY
jgi:hypothetical protein